jgi:hypothetical protein
MARLPGERGAALLAVLAETADMGASAQRDGALFELDGLGQPKTRLRGEVQQHVIAPADPCALVGRRQDRVDLGAGEKVHLALVVELAGDRQDALNLPAIGGLFERCVVPQALHHSASVQIIVGDHRRSSAHVMCVGSQKLCRAESA